MMNLDVKFKIFISVQVALFMTTLTSFIQRSPMSLGRDGVNGTAGTYGLPFITTDYFNSFYFDRLSLMPTGVIINFICYLLIFVSIFILTHEKNSRSSLVKEFLSKQNIINILGYISLLFTLSFLVKSFLLLYVVLGLLSVIAVLIFWLEIHLENSKQIKLYRYKMIIFSLVSTLILTSVLLYQSKIWITLLNSQLCGKFQICQSVD